MRHLIYVLALTPTLALAQAPGDACDKPDEVAEDGTLVCAPARNEDGSVILDHYPARVVNGRRGDVIMSAGCGGTVSSLLRAVNQSYTHSGMMLDNQTIRHSTGDINWLMAHPDDMFLTPGEPVDGFDGQALEFLWPGLIDQGIEDAFRGGYVLDDSNSHRKIKAFDHGNGWCAPDQPKNPTLLVKPMISPYDAAPLTSWDDEEVRDDLHGVADAMEALHGHYRFGVYTAAADLPAAPADLGWLPSSDATVCSSSVWMAGRDAGITFEGTLEQEDCDRGAFAGDFVCDPGVDSQPNPLHDGLYDYPESVRSSGAVLLDDMFRDLVQGKLADMDNTLAEIVQGLENPVEDVANQVVNCFAFDWCGPADSPVDLDALPVSCGGGDPQDSTCWTNPGDGRAISPDDITSWDGPDKGGSYGFPEPAVFDEEHYEQRYAWARSADYGSVEGRLLDMDGHAEGGVAVRLGDLENWTTSSGQFVFAAAKPGDYALEGCKELNDLPGQYLVYEGKVQVLADHDIDLGDLDMTSQYGCPFPQLDDLGKYRWVELSGETTIVDDEWWPASDVKKTFDLAEILEAVEPGMGVKLCRNSADECSPSETLSFEACVGNEVRAEIDVTLSLLDDTTVKATAKVDLYEGTSCNTMDRDGSIAPWVQVSAGDIEAIDESVTNCDWEEDDRIDLTLEISNKPYYDVWDE